MILATSTARLFSLRSAVFWAAIVSEGAVLYCKFFTPMAWLWWNVVGCVVGVVVAVVLERTLGRERAAVPA